jgi:predicted HicB family RNase H-like nuclease
MQHKGYYGTVEYTPEDGILFGRVLGVNGIVSYEGADIKTLQQDFETAVDDYLDWCLEAGEQPGPALNGDIHAKIPPETHALLAAYALRQNESIEEVMKEAITRLVG